MLPCLRRLFLLSVMVSSAVAGSATQANSGPEGPSPRTLVVRELGKGAVPLGGLWQFHTGDDTAWASPAFDDSSWEAISPAKTWGEQGHEGYIGFAWYRRTISLTPASGASPDFALFVPNVQDAYEIYWNGSLVGGVGKLPPNPEYDWRPPPHTWGLGPARNGVLALRVWKAPLDSFDAGTLGGFTGTPMVGSPEAIGALKDKNAYTWLRSHQVIFGLDSLYALIALISLTGWLRDRRQRLLFWVACFSGSAAILDLLERAGIPIPVNIAEGVAQPFFGSVAVATWFVLILLLDLDKFPRFMRLVRWFAILAMVLFTLDGILALGTIWFPESWTVGTQWADAVLTAIYTALLTTPVWIILYAIWRRQRLHPDRWFVAACAFLGDGVPTLRSALSQGERFTHLTLADKLAAPLFIVRGNPLTLQSLSGALLQIALAYAAFRYISDERRRQVAVEQEIKNARELQQVLIPETIPQIPSFTLTSAYKPAQEVGGDFFQIIPISSGSTLLVLGDVSGKGLRAAMAVSLIVGAVRMAAEGTSSPAAILAALNRRLHGRLQGGFATCVAMRLDRDGSCTVASAGHPAPFLNDAEISLPGAFPLGLDEDAAYAETTFALHPTDRLALYTDGLLEARNPSGELYSFARLQSLFATKPTADQALEAAVEFGQDDDITVLTLTRLDSAA